MYYKIPYYHRKRFKPVEKMEKETYFVSIRVIKAKNEKEALGKMLSEDFDESHELCDKILPIEIIKH